jgi:hypothetical protein
MSMQMYIITFKGGFTPSASREVQHQIRKLGGFILMVTSSGPIIAIDDTSVAAVGKHPAVAFVGPVSFNPRGRAAQALERLFAENLSKQINLPSAGGPAPGTV